MREETQPAYAGNCHCVRLNLLMEGRKESFVIEISFVTGKTTEPSRTSLNFVSQSLYKYIY